MLKPVPPPPPSPHPTPPLPPVFSIHDAMEREKVIHFATDFLFAFFINSLSELVQAEHMTLA